MSALFALHASRRCFLSSHLDCMMVDQTGVEPVTS